MNSKETEILNEFIINRSKPFREWTFNTIMCMLRDNFIGKTDDNTFSFSESVVVPTGILVNIASLLLQTKSPSSSNTAWSSIPARHAIRSKSKVQAFQYVFTTDNISYSTDGPRLFVSRDAPFFNKVLDPFTLLPIPAGDIEPPPIEKFFNYKAKHISDISLENISARGDMVSIPGSNKKFDKTLFESFIKKDETWRLVHINESGFHVFTHRDKNNKDRLVVLMPLADWVKK